MNAIVGKIILILAAIGAINWGLAAFGYDLVDLILGSIPTVATIVYVVIGLCGIWALIKILKK